MAFICTDVGTTKREGMTPTRVLRIWEKRKGICIICDVLIDGAREDWFIEHPRALELGGPDTDDNAGPAHWYHKAAKDAADHAAAAKAKRMKRTLLGIKSAKKQKIPQRPKSLRVVPDKLPLPPRQFLYE